MKTNNADVALPEGLPVVVTGATGGIGREIVRAVARLGHPMILPCRSRAKFDALAADMRAEFPNIRLSFVALDLNDSASVKAAAAALAGMPLAAVVNNAGIMCRHYTLSPDGPETTLNVNYFNTMLLNDALLPQVAAGGALVFTTSVTRRFVPKGDSPATVNARTFGQLRTYALSKKLIARYALSLAADAARRGVRVNCCDPGIVDSGMITMHRWFDPLADIFFRPFIRSARGGAVPAMRALLSPLSGRIFTLRGIHSR